MIIDPTELKVLDKIEETSHIISSDFKEEYNKINIIRKKNRLIKIYVIFKIFVFVSGFFSFFLFLIPNSIEENIKFNLTTIKELIFKNENDTKEYLDTIELGGYNILSNYSNGEFTHKSYEFTLKQFYYPFINGLEINKLNLSYLNPILSKEFYKITDLSFEGFSSKKLSILSDTQRKQICDITENNYICYNGKFYKGEGIFSFKIGREFGYDIYKTISDIVISCNNNDYKYCESAYLNQEIDDINFKTVICTESCTKQNNGEYICKNIYKITNNLDCTI